MVTTVHCRTFLLLRKIVIIPLSFLFHSFPPPPMVSPPIVPSPTPIVLSPTPMVSPPRVLPPTPMFSWIPLLPPPPLHLIPHPAPDQPPQHLCNGQADAEKKSSMQMSLFHTHHYSTWTKSALISLVGNPSSVSSPLSSTTFFLLRADLVGVSAILDTSTRYLSGN